MAINAPILEFKHISKNFNKTVVLSDLNFDVRENETLGIIGRSGSGKTTLFRLIIGYYEPTHGEVIFRNKNISKTLATLRSNIGYTTQDNSFYDKLTVMENMRYYAKLYKIKRPDLTHHINTLLEEVELLPAANMIAEKLSGGMKRRLDFAISIVHSPNILVMDEPTTGLDPSLTRQFWEIVKAQKAEGKTIIITSHIFEEIEANCDRVLILEQGAIKHILNPAQIKGGVYKFLYSNI